MSCSYSQVMPLSFEWQDLSASELKSLMRISNNDDMPLYMVCESNHSC